MPRVVDHLGSSWPRSDACRSRATEVGDGPSGSRSERLVWPFGSRGVMDLRRVMSGSKEWDLIVHGIVQTGLGVGEGIHWLGRTAHRLDGRAGEDQLGLGDGTVVGQDAADF